MDRLLKLMRTLSEERRAELQELLANVPYWLINEFNVVKIPKNKTFIKSGEAATRVYILLRGNVKATDYGIFGVVYDYTWFEPIEIFGAMEFYMGYDCYVTTLIAMTDCQMLEMPLEYYKRWMMEDHKILLKQVREMMRRLNDQSQKEREFLFLSGTQRLLYLLVQMYERYEKEGVCIIRITKEELANYSGINIRTVTRAVQQMLEDGLITKSGRTLSINQGQCEEMKLRLPQK